MKLKSITFEIFQSVCNQSGMIGCNRGNSLLPKSFVGCKEDACPEWKLISDDIEPDCQSCQRLRELCGELWLLVDDLNYQIPATKFHELEQRLKAEGILK